MIGRGRELRRDRRASHATLSSSPDPDYSLGLGEVLVHEEGVVRNTRSRVAIPYNYEQPTSSTTVTSPELMRRLFYWSDEEDEDSGYASSVKVSQYDQIKMYPEDEKHTSFRAPLGVYCYIVMPFGLRTPEQPISGQ